MLKHNCTPARKIQIYKSGFLENLKVLCDLKMLCHVSILSVSSPRMMHLENFTANNHLLSFSIYHPKCKCVSDFLKVRAEHVCIFVFKRRK